MADDYTPSMDDLREAYEYMGDGADFRSARDRRRAEFDRAMEAQRREQIESDAQIAERVDIDNGPWIAAAIREQKP